MTVQPLHGTPKGWTLGCRSTGGCPNSNTPLMTCAEAKIRYAGDHAYRKAYDAGDVWLSKATDAPPAPMAKAGALATAERQLRSSTVGPVRTAKPKPAIVPTPAPARVPTAPPAETRPEPEESPRWRHGGYGYNIKKCRCDICKAAHTETARRSRVKVQQAAREAGQTVETALPANLSALAEAAPALTTPTTTDDLTFRRLQAENDALRAEVARLTEAARPPRILFDFVDGALTVALEGRLDVDGITGLRSYLTELGA